MNPRLRPAPFPYPVGWWAEYKRLLAGCTDPISRYIARFTVNSANRRARMVPMPGERCCAHAKSTGKPCMAKAWANGRCCVHGGLSTGARTPEGKARAVQNLKQFHHK